MSFWRNRLVMLWPKSWQQFKPSGLFLQAFLGFWLTIISILILLAALGQLQPERLDSKPLKGKLLDTMGHISHNIERLVNTKNKPIEKVITHPRF